MGRHDEWVARDTAVVWHGFTQMDAYAENAPVLVELGEGNELIDVDGRRYLDAISSLWVNTLGHHVPELDDAIRQQLERGAHSTMLGNGNVVVVELAEALARSSSPSAAHTTATPSARSRSGPAGSARTCSTRCASRCCARRISRTPTAS